jgi:DDE_Tnp_1-associated
MQIGMEQARTSGIMRLPRPHDHNGHPCLPGSSPIPPAFSQLGHALPLQAAEARHLLAYLATIPDPRQRRGRRHPLLAILAMAAAAVLTGARSVAAIAEWAADAPQPVRAALAPAATPPTGGWCPPRPPSAASWAAWTQRRWLR